METPGLDQLTDQYEKEYIIRELGSSDLIEISRGDPANKESDRRIKSFGFKANSDWVSDSAQWIFFTGPDDVPMLTAFVTHYDEVLSWIPVEHIANFVEAERVLDLLLKEF
jgi:hypothetical protein